MPRPRLSEEERRRRAVVRTARWRRNVPAFTPASTPFIHTSFPPPPSLPARAQHLTSSLAGSARAAATRATADIAPQLGSRNQPAAPELAASSRLATEPARPRPRPGGGSADASSREERLESEAESEAASDYLRADHEDELENEDNIDSFEDGIDNNTEQLEYDSDGDIDLFRGEHISRLDDRIDQSQASSKGSASVAESEPWLDIDLIASESQGNSDYVGRVQTPSLRRARSELEEGGSSEGDDEGRPLQALRGEQAASVDRAEDASDLNDEEDEDNEDDEALLEAQLLGLDLAEGEPEVDLAYEFGRHLIRFQGCSEAEHTEADNKHRISAEAAASHLTLQGYKDLIIAARVPIRLGGERRLTRAEQARLPLPHWSLIFEGRAEAEDGDDAASQDLRDSDEEASQDRIGGDEEPNYGIERPELCLQCSQVDSTSSEINFDIDSFLGFPRSLAFARQGVLINLYPRFHTNIQANLKLFLTVPYDGGRGERPTKVRLQQVPHYCWGRVIGHEDAAVFVFFPRMYDPDKATNFPGGGGGERHSLLRTWTDSILLPAIFRHAPATSRQHYPSSWEHAQRKSHARWPARGDAAQAAEPSARSLALHYPLSPRALLALWQDIEQQLTLPRNKIYQGAKLFFSSKNTKLQFTYPTLAATWQAFKGTLSTTFDFAYLDRKQFWIDLGKEIVCRNYALPNERLDADSPAATYLLRTCCQESFARWAALGEGKKSVKATYYPVAMLRDACDLTLEMSRSSRKRELGWVYSQLYNSVKEIYDAAKSKPFTSLFLGQLAWDPLVAKMLRQQGKGAPATMAYITRGYLSDSQRLAHALVEAQSLSFGSREEHRISLFFMDQVQERLETAGHWDRALEVTDASYEHIWELPTIDYIMYLGMNANKFAAAFEWILCLGEPGRISYEHCKVLTMLLQALPFAFDSGPIKRRDEIWQARFQRRKGGPRVLGMGLKGTVAASGYGWLLPRIDWGQLTFRGRFDESMAFNSSMLRDTYHKNWPAVKDAKDDLARLETAGRWLRLYKTQPSSEEYITQFLLILIMRSYRKEVFRHLKPLVRPEFHKKAAKGEIMLCYASIQEHFTAESVANIRLVEPRRTKTRTIEDLVSFLWDFPQEGGPRRDRWEDAPFRLLCRRALELIREHCGRAARDYFHDGVKRYFIATHWLIPQPTATKFIQRGREKHIQWTGVYHRRLAISTHKQGQHIQPDILLMLVESQPKIYRPKRFPWIVPEDPADRLGQWYVPVEYRYMEDWDLLNGHRGPLMSQLPIDFEGLSIPYDSKLTIISDMLDLSWRTWRQAAEGDAE